jgi:hypothetical protein
MLKNAVLFGRRVVAPECLDDLGEPGEAVLDGTAERRAGERLSRCDGFAGHGHEGSPWVSGIAE